MLGAPTWARLRAWLNPCNVGDDAGVAVIIVMLSALAMMALAVATVGYAEGSLGISRHDEDWNAALAAAQAGIDDYIHRLNENASYWTYSASNPPSDGNGAFTGYVPIPGGNTDSSYRYTADPSTIETDGTVKLTSTGKVGTTRRTVQATLRRRDFIDYLWFTDYETIDPALYTGSPFTAAQAQQDCALHYYEGRNSGCSDPSFISADSVNGPLHSNDAILVNGTPHFNGDTSTSWNTPAPRYRDPSGSSAPVFATSGDPRYLPPLTMPPSNSAIKAETAQSSGGSFGGCLYTGPTTIILNSAGTMTVESPFSKQTDNSCPTNGTGSLPVDGVIYVQNVPATTTDTNYTSGCPYSGVKLPGSTTGRAHPLGYPTSNDVTTYGCRNGDVFVQGTVKGQVTIAAENDVVITGNLEYSGGTSGTDLLGLVANNDVQIYHPVDSSGNELYADPVGGTQVFFRNPQVYAAVLSVNHSFRVQNWDSGNPANTGTLNLTGAIAQRFRGPVGTFDAATGQVSTGYAKNYVYDQRLKYLAPPNFLDPVASAWGIAVWAEQQNPAGV